MKRTKFNGHNVFVDDTVMYVTDNYDIFKIWPGNRPVVPKKVNVIKKSILKNKWMFNQTILIGPNSWIADGQHRLQALKEIKKETGKAYMIRYQVDENLTLDDVITMNSTSTTWNAYAHLYSQCKRRRREYIALDAFMKKYKLSVYTAAMLARGVGNTGSDFKTKFETGGFEADDWDKAEIRAQHLAQINKYFNKSHNSYFIKAMFSFWRHPNFNNDSFIHKLEMNRSMVYPCASMEQYKTMILKLYNYKSHKKIRID